MEPYLEKQQKIKTLFQACQTNEQRYQTIIAIGKNLPKMPPEFKTEENIVHGCQSIVYLHSSFHEGKIFFTAFSEALITSGLASLLIMAYSGESPETVLQHKPSFFEELNIYASLSPGRSNGLASMYLSMQRDALKILV